MPITQKVGLEGIRFFAYHGFYPEEQLTGNEFIVDVITEMNVTDSGDDELSNTVNYEQLFEITAGAMKKPKKLVETVAHAILEETAAAFPFVHKIEVCIRKMRLPLKGEIKNSLIQLTFNR